MPHDLATPRGFAPGLTSVRRNYRNLPQNNSVRCRPNVVSGGLGVSPSHPLQVGGLLAVPSAVAMLTIFRPCVWQHAQPSSTSSAVVPLPSRRSSFCAVARRLPWSPASPLHVPKSLMKPPKYVPKCSPTIVQKYLQSPPQTSQTHPRQ